MKRFIKVSAFLVMSGSLLVGCAKDDAYDSNYKTNQYQTSFEKVFGTIDSQQDWNMVSSRTANIAVKMGTGESYSVGVYKDDPLFHASNCGLLAMGKVADGGSVTLKFDSPTAQTKYYVGLFDSKGRSVAQIDSLTNDVLNVNFGGASAAAKTRGVLSSTYAQTWSDRSGGLNPATMRTSNDYVDLSEVPSADLQKMTDSDNKNQFHGYKYKVKQGETFQGSFAIQNAILFVDGTLDLSGSDNLVFNRSKLVISSTGKVILHKDVSMSETGTQLLIEAGGQLVSDGNYTFVITNGGSSYSAGTISMPNGTFIFNGTDLYNSGTIKVKYLFNSTQAGKLTNFGIVDCYTNDYNNAGSFNCTYINCCYMKFDHCNIGGFIMTDNSRIDVANLLFTTGKNSLGNASEVNAGSMKLNNAVFIGPVENKEFAIIKTKKFLVSYVNDGTFDNNVYVDCDKTQCYKYDGTAWDMENQYKGGYQFVYQKIKNWSTESTSLNTIPKGDCTGAGYNPNGGGGTIPTTVPAYCFAFEDLGSVGDFDFNDVVLYVYPDKTNNKLKIDLVAAGGTLISDVYFNNEKIFTTTGQMINTSNPDYSSVIQTVTKDLPSGYTFSSNNYTGLFKIVVGGETSISASTATGKAPQALVIPAAWKWPKEQVNICTVYTKFKEWVADKSKSTNWYDVTE